MNASSRFTDILNSILFLLRFIFVVVLLEGFFFSAVTEDEHNFF